jgi:ubiquinone/menaquinone biosynthesis C-methylase UbiE
VEATLPTPRAPFLDPATIRDDLYGSSERLAGRTAALHRAKAAGADASETIAALAASITDAPTMVADIGCGRGTTTLRLSRLFPAASLVAVDQSPALLAIVNDRFRSENRDVRIVAADFHHLRSVLPPMDLAVAAFCLYHSSDPLDVLSEIAACLIPGGYLIAVTKSPDSYREIDSLLASTGLDPDACRRPSLYETFNSDNANTLVSASGFMVRQRVDQRHVFRFNDLDHLAEYASTIPKYQLPPALTESPDALAAALRAHVPDSPFTTFSTVTYVVAQRS